MQTFTDFDRFTQYLMEKGGEGSWETKPGIYTLFSQSQPFALGYQMMQNPGTRFEKDGTLIWYAEEKWYIQSQQ